MNPINQKYLKMYQQPQLLFVADLFENLTDYDELSDAILASKNPEDTLELFRQTSQFIQSKLQSVVARGKLTEKVAKSNKHFRLEYFRDTPALEALLGALVKLSAFQEFSQSKEFQEYGATFEADLQLFESSENPLKFLVECFGFFLLYNNQIWIKIFRSSRDQRRLPLMSLLIRNDVCQVPRSARP